MREDDRRLDQCLNCTDCNAACPVTKVSPSFPGPKALGPGLERVRKEGIKCETPWLEYCIGCNRCELACPNSVNVSELIGRAKLKQPKGGLTVFRNWLLARPDLLGRLCSVAPAITNAALRTGLNRQLMSSVLRISKNRVFPEYHWPRVAIKKNGMARKVVFFPGCYIRYNDPALMQTSIGLLQKYSSVEIAPARCCSVPALANGDQSRLNQDLRANIEYLGAKAEAGADIVAACTSCSHMLKAEYPRLLKDDAQLAGRAQSVSEHTFDLAEYLLECAFGDKPAVELHPVKLRVAYHAPCHLKAQGIGRPWLRILRTIPELVIEEMTAECCGMAGTFGFKEEKYKVSMDIGEELFGAIRSYHPDLAVSECSTCRMQIEHGTSIRALHPAEILRRALVED